MMQRAAPKYAGRDKFTKYDKKERWSINEEFSGGLRKSIS